MSYVAKLSPQAKENAQILTERLNAKGITNPMSQAGILAIVSKESGFMPKLESSYRNTSNARIRQIFGSRVSKLTEDQLTTLKANDIAFFEQIYGPQNTKLGLGNTKPGDAYKYRGAGLNQLTGKYAFKYYGDKIGVDLVANPEKMQQMGIASDVLIEFFKDRFKSPANKLKTYNSTGINDFKSVADSTGAFYHANSGWGTSTQHITADVTDGRKKAMSVADELYEFVKNTAGQGIDLAKKKPGPTIAIAFILTLAIVYLIKTIKNKK